MASTSTLGTILGQLVEELDIGIVLSGLTGTTTTLTLTTTGASELRGPFTGKKIPIGSPVIVTAGGTAGEDTYVSDWAPSTGVITVSPAISSSTTDCIILYADAFFNHFDRLIRAVNRALTNRVSRWQKVPLTFVPDGEYKSAVATYWTASAGTQSYTSVASPETHGTVLQIQHSSAATSTSNTIPARASEQWRFYTAIRAASDGDTATFEILDITNSTTITPSYEEGSGSTTSRAFVNQKGTFTVPATCDRIAFRLGVTGSGTMTSQMTTLIAYPQDARTFPFTSRVLQDRIGNFFYVREGGNPTGPEERSYGENILTHGRTATISDTGDHLTVTFNFTPAEPVFYDEQIFGSSLSAISDTTVFPLDQVTKWAKYELDKMRYEQMVRRRSGENAADRTQELARWARVVNASLREAQRASYEPTPMTVTGRV